MKKLSTKEIRTIKKRLINTFNDATKKDIADGMKWYADANEICNNLAVKYDTDVYSVASVLSALSPRNKWSKNIIDTETVLKAYKNNVSAENIKVSTFHSNKFKAFNILKGNISITDNSLKTFNFVHNIAYLDASSLTVDIWHIRASLGKKVKIDNAQIGRTAYNQIKELTINTANELGIKGYEFQAIIWLVTQRNYNK